MKATATLDDTDATRMTVDLSWEFSATYDARTASFVRIDWDDGTDLEPVAEGTTTATHVYDPARVGYTNQEKNIRILGNDVTLAVKQGVGAFVPPAYSAFPPDPNRGFQQSTWDDALIDAAEVIKFPSGDIPPGRGNKGLVNPGR